MAQGELGMTILAMGQTQQRIYGPRATGLYTMQVVAMQGVMPWSPDPDFAPVKR